MSKENDPLPSYLTVAQVADAGGFSEPTVRKAILDGQLPASKPVGRDIRIRREDFRLWMSKGFAPAREAQVDRDDLREEWAQACVNFEPEKDEKGNEMWVWRDLSGLYQPNPHTFAKLICKYPPTLQIVMRQQVSSPLEQFGANLHVLFENVAERREDGNGERALEIAGKVCAIFPSDFLRRGRTLSVVGNDYDPRKDGVQIYLKISQEDADKLWDLAAKKAVETHSAAMITAACFVAGALAMSYSSTAHPYKTKEIVEWIEKCSDTCSPGSFEDVVRGVLEDTISHPLTDPHKHYIMEQVRIIEQAHRNAPVAPAAPSKIQKATLFQGDLKVEIDKEGHVKQTAVKKGRPKKVVVDTAKHPGSIVVDGEKISVGTFLPDFLEPSNEEGE